LGEFLIVASLSYDSLNFITDCGDSVVTFTFTLLSAMFFLVYKQNNAAIAMVMAFCASAAAILLCKFAIYAHYVVLPVNFDIYSPSGHCAISLSVYGTFAAIAASSQAGWRKIIPFLFVGPLILLIAVSRIYLYAHSINEVVVGLCIGASIFCGIWLVLLKNNTVRCSWLPFTLVCLTIMVTVYGHHLPAEKLVKHISAYFYRNG
jgi:membrane-associated phospholipid phosphatase